MKLFKGHFFLGLIMTALCVAGCSNDDFQETKKPAVITITADAPNQEATRVKFGKENFAISWKEGDAFQVYSNGAAGNKFDFVSKDAQGRGQFRGNKPSVSGDMFAYYPAAKSQNTGRDNDLFDYTGQTQAGNDNVDGLSNYLYMMGDVDPVDYSVSNFVLQPAILKMTINMPAGFEGAVSSVAIDFVNTKFHKRKHVKASLDVEADDALSMSMSLTDVSLAKEEQLVVYMAMAPMQVSDDVFTLTVTAGDVQYVSTIENFTYNFEQAKVCPAVLTVEEVSNEKTLKEFHDIVAAMNIGNRKTADVSDVVLQGVVVYKDNSKIHIADGTAGFCCYINNKFVDFVEGEEYVVTPTKVYNYNGLYEITAGTFDKVDDSTKDRNTYLANVTVADINAVTDTHYQGMYVHLSGVKADRTNWSSGTKLLDGADEIKTWSNSSELKALNSLESTLDVWAVVEYYNGYQLKVLKVDVTGEPSYMNDLVADKASGIDIEGGSVEITVDSNVAWTSSISGEGATITSAQGVSPIVVQFSKNETPASRTVTVTVTSDDEALVKTIELTQDGPYINDLTADKSSNLLADGSEDPIITVDANVAWTAEVSGDATIASSSATTFQVNVPKNEAEQEVTYIVTVTSADGAIVKTIDLVQLAAGATIPVVTLKELGDYSSNFMTYFGDNDWDVENKHDDGGYVKKIASAYFPGDGSKPSYTHDSSSYYGVKLSSASKMGRVSVKIPTPADKDITVFSFYVVGWNSEYPQLSVTGENVDVTIDLGSEANAENKSKAFVTNTSTGALGLDGFVPLRDVNYFEIPVVEGQEYNIQVTKSQPKSTKDVRCVLFGLNFQ